MKGVCLLKVLMDIAEFLCKCTYLQSLQPENAGHFPHTHANTSYYCFKHFSNPIFEKHILVVFSSICVATNEIYHF